MQGSQSPPLDTDSVLGSGWLIHVQVAYATATANAWAIVTFPGPQVHSPIAKRNDGVSNPKGSGSCTNYSIESS